MIRSTRRAFLVVAIALASVFLFASDLQAGPGKGNGGGGGGGGPQKGTIVGEVVGGSGPIAGASVLLFDGVAIDQVAETVSGPDGSFQFNKVPAGDYTITAVSWNPPCAGNTAFTVEAKKIVVVVVACQ